MLFLFTCTLWIIILHKYKSMSHNLGYKWDHVAVCCDSWSNSICPSPGANPWLCNWQKAPTPHSFTNSSQHINPPIWPKDFKLWFISPMDYIPLLCLLILFCFFKSGFLSAILLYKPTSQSFSSQWMLTHFFHDINLVVQYYLKLSAFCHANWWLWWNCPLHR